MGLRYVREESTGSALLGEEQIAESVRQFIEEATYALDQPVSQREHNDADNGYAARILLGLEVGTDVLLLTKRRKKASSVVGLTISGMAKRRQGSRTSWEQRLMNALARKMMERENAFLRRQTLEQQRKIVQPFSLVPSYEILLLAHVSTGTLISCIAMLHMYTHEPTKLEEYRLRCQWDQARLEQEHEHDVIEAMASYGRIMTITRQTIERLRMSGEALLSKGMYPENHDWPLDGVQMREVDALPSKSVVRIIDTFSPWTERERLELIAIVRRILDGAPLDGYRLRETLRARKYQSLRRALDVWIARCPCNGWQGQPVEGCPVHLVTIALEVWEKRTRHAWTEIGKSLSSIDRYAKSPPSQILAELGIEHA